MIVLVRDAPTVTALVNGAKAGDQHAWGQIVERYAPLVWSMCRRFGLRGADTDDVGASVWLRLVEKIDTIREPAALPGWLATTTRNECIRVVRAKNRETPFEDEPEVPDDSAATADAWLLKQERHIALRDAFATLSKRCRELLTLLFSDKTLPYQEVGATLGMSIGSIGPTRQRCLERLRADPALAELADSTPLDSR